MTTARAACTYPERVDRLRLWLWLVVVTVAVAVATVRAAVRAAAL